LVSWNQSNSFEAIDQTMRQEHFHARFQSDAGAGMNPKRHVEKILDRIGAGDVSVACWEPARSAPITATRRHRNLFLLRGRRQDAHAIRDNRRCAGMFVVHPAGEVHEYANGPHRTLLFRVRYGADMRAHHAQWRTTRAGSNRKRMLRTTAATRSAADEAEVANS